MKGKAIENSEITTWGGINVPASPSINSFSVDRRFEQEQDNYRDKMAIYVKEDDALPC